MRYWRAVGLIPPADRSGQIKLTEFGRKIADHDISQTEFAAITVQTFKLPNSNIQSEEECRLWLQHGIILHPLRLLLEIEMKLNELGQGFITTEELIKIIIPLSGCKAELQDYINFILWYRTGEISLIGWPNCCPEANDMRIAREYLLFLSNYGYIIHTSGDTRMEEKNSLNAIIADEIREIIAEKTKDASLLNALDQIRATEVIAEVERKRVQISPSPPIKSTAAMLWTCSFYDRTVSFSV